MGKKKKSLQYWTRYMAIIGTKLLNHNIIIFQMQHHITYNLVGQEVDSNDFWSTWK